MATGQARCLVTGATGYIGSRLVPKLLDEGHRVRALARNPSKLASKSGGVPWRERAEVVQGDLGDVDSLEAAFDGVDVVYYLVHSMGTSTDFVDEEIHAARNVVAAARRARVGRVVYLSGLHPEGRKLSPHLESRKAVGDVLIESGIETVVLQAGIVVGSGSASFEMIRHLTDRLPVMTTPKWVHNRIQPIAVDDALYYLAAAATARIPSSRTWDIGGPDVLEYGDMIRVYAEEAQLGNRYLIALPFLTPTIASLWIGTVTPIPPGLARPLIASLECDAVMRDFQIDTIIEPPPSGLTGYREAIALALNRTQQGLPDATWDSQSKPAEPLPSDPDWAGEIVYTDVRTATTSAAADEVWKAAEDAASGSRWYPFTLTPWRGSAVERWSVTEREPGTKLRLRAETRGPGQPWLEITIEPQHGGGSKYTQRAIFFPHGIPGRVYWTVLRPLHTAALRRLARDIVRILPVDGSKNGTILIASN